MAMKSGTARRYAEAAFGLATAAGAVDAWQEQLHRAAELAADTTLARAVDSPAVPFGERRRTVEQLLSPRVSQPIVNLALLLASRGRFGALPDVVTRFDDLVRESRGIAAATVTSAAPLTKDEEAAMGRRVQELAGRPVEMTTAVDPSLIGGLTVRIGDRLIDASVRGRLERLRERLIQGAA